MKNKIKRAIAFISILAIILSVSVFSVSAHTLCSDHGWAQYYTTARAKNNTTDSFSILARYHMNGRSVDYFLDPNTLSGSNKTKVSNAMKDGFALWDGMISGNEITQPNPDGTYNAHMIVWYNRLVRKIS